MPVEGRGVSRDGWALFDDPTMSMGSFKIPSLQTTQLDGPSFGRAQDIRYHTHPTLPRHLARDEGGCGGIVGDVGGRVRRVRPPQRNVRYMSVTRTDS